MLTSQTSEIRPAFAKRPEHLVKREVPQCGVQKVVSEICWIADGIELFD